MNIYNSAGFTRLQVLLVGLVVVAVGAWFYFSNSALEDPVTEGETAQQTSSTTDTSVKDKPANGTVPKQTEQATGKQTYVSKSFVLEDRDLSLAVLKGGKEIQLLVQDWDMTNWINGTRAASSSRKIDPFVVADINFDGYVDVAMLSGYAMTIDEYDYYVFNPITERLERDVLLVKLPNPTFDAKSKTISTINSFGVRTVEQEYVFNGSTYVVGDEIRTCRDKSICGDE